MFRKFFCIVYLFSVSAFNCSASDVMIVTEGKLANFCESAHNGVVYVYNNNTSFVKKACDVFKLSGKESVEEFIKCLLHKDSKSVISGKDLTIKNRINMLTYIYVYAAFGLQFVEKDDLFQEVVDFLSLPFDADSKSQNFIIAAIYDVIYNSDSIKMKDYASGLLRYFKNRSVADVKTIKKTINVLSQKTEENKPQKEKCEQPVKFHAGDSNTSLKFGEDNLNIHQLRERSFGNENGKIGFLLNSFHDYFELTSNDTLLAVQSILSRSIPVICLNNALSFYHVLGLLGIHHIMMYSAGNMRMRYEVCKSNISEWTNIIKNDEKVEKLFGWINFIAPDLKGFKQFLTNGSWQHQSHE